MVPQKYHFMSIRRAFYHKEVTVMNLYEQHFTEAEKTQFAGNTRRRNEQKYNSLILGAKQTEASEWCFVFF